MGRSGFTLVETLVALVVLALGLLALAQLSVVSGRAASFSREFGEGTVLAQSKMEELRRYAIPNQPGTFSVYDFSYLSSTKADFAKIADPPSSTTLIQVPGLLSGSSSPAGVPVTTTGGTLYDVLYDNGTRGDATSGDGIYTSSDIVYSGSGTSAPPASGDPGTRITRVWTVQPITLNGRTDYARFTVTATWTGRTGQTRTCRFESLAHRRQ